MQFYPSQLFPPSDYVHQLPVSIAWRNLAIIRSKWIWVKLHKYLNYRLLFTLISWYLSLGRSISLGSKNSLKQASSTPGTIASPRAYPFSFAITVKSICISQGLRYKNLGKSGLRVSNVGLGTWSIFSNGVTEEQAETIVRKLACEGIYGNV